MSRVTTIIPTYKRPHLLVRAIRSVLSQTVRDLCVLVLDNASGDETSTVVEEIARSDSRVRYICHATNIGSYANFNFGLLKVETDYFSFLSDDDYLLPEFYERAFTHFDNYPAIGFVATGVLNECEGYIVGERPVETWRAGVYRCPEGALAMLRNGEPTWTGILFHRGVRDRLGAIPNFNAPSDLAYVLAAACKFNFYFDPTPCAVFIPASAAMTNSTRGDIEQYWPAWAEMVAYLDRIEDWPAENRFELWRRLCGRIHERIRELAVIGAIRRDRKSVRKAIRTLEQHFGGRDRAFAFVLQVASLREFYPITVLAWQIRRRGRQIRYWFAERRLPEHVIRLCRRIGSEGKH